MVFYEFSLKKITNCARSKRDISYITSQWIIGRTFLFIQFCLKKIECKMELNVMNKNKDIYIERIGQLSIERIPHVATSNTSHVCPWYHCINTNWIYEDFPMVISGLNGKFC